ncbi:hypothetical protein LG293_03075 [Citricoccus nitrophenolicus]|uniref:PknH-like protein n=1 Tax=Citricoccus muralis TaxID=169134 RepID=A0A3D9LDR1_9MICC|nr:hypothetical protein [Citricoccus muralis]REE04010.1 hypothetical protein C8E99_1834 [Citricoccus muralis]
MRRQAAGLVLAGLLLTGCGAPDPADTPPQSEEQLRAMLLTMEEYGLEGAGGPGEQIDPSLIATVVDDPSQVEGACADALQALQSASFETTASAAAAVSVVEGYEDAYLPPILSTALFAREDGDGPEPGPLYTAVGRDCEGAELRQGEATVTVAPLPGDRDGLVAHSSGDELLGDASVTIAVETVGHHHVMVSGILVDPESVVAAFDRQVEKLRQGLLAAAS